MLLFLIISSLPLLFFVSCRHGLDDDGFPIIVQHRFWNYYERGLAKSLKDEWQKAVADFQIALGEKEGALYPGPKEKRRTKMYGLRYYDDYFPNRELGICYYFLGQYESAEKKLKISLEMLPSSRAKFYLNKVIKAQLTLLKTRPHTPLAITVEWPEAPFFTNNPQLTLKGNISGSIPIEKIWINHSRQLFELAVTTVDVHQEIRLKPGKNSIRIDAQNLLEERRTWEQEVFVDLKGPEIAISTSINQIGKRVRVEVLDPGGLSALTINGKPVLIKADATSHSAEINIKSKSTIKVEARDRAGNRTSIEHSTKDLRRASLEFFKTTNGRKLAYHNYTITPLLHHSIIPSFHHFITPNLEWHQVTNPDPIF